MNHVYSHPTSKATYLSVLVISWYSTDFLKISHFRLKLWKNFQFLQGCQKISRLREDTCDTAFESLDTIVFDMIIFGYYSGTQNTQIMRYVRHLKWGRLERGHFELFGIRQQVLTITNIIKKSALPSSFRKYLAPRSYLLFLMIYLQI